MVQPLPLRTEAIAIGAAERLALTVTYPPREGGSVLVLCPPFGRRRDQLAKLSASLAVNGFANVRLDLRNHAGQSVGDILEFRLTQVIKDIEETTEWVRHRFAEASLHLVTTSLCTRPALRFLAASNGRAEYSSLSSIVPVLDVRDAVYRASGTDFVGRAKEKTLGNGPFLIMDHLISGAFAYDAVESGMDTAEGSLADLDEVELPINLFAAAEDEWVDFERLESIRRARPKQVHLFNVENARHEIGRNLAATRVTVRALIERLFELEGARNRVVEPSLEELVAFARLDRETRFSATS